VEEQWSALSGSIVRAGNDFLGFARRHQPDWFTENQGSIQPLLDERRQYYNRWVASGQGSC